MTLPPNDYSSWVKADTKTGPRQADGPAYTPYAKRDPQGAAKLEAIIAGANGNPAPIIVPEPPKRPEPAPLPRNAPTPEIDRALDRLAAAVIYIPTGIIWAIAAAVFLLTLWEVVLFTAPVADDIQHRLEAMSVAPG